MEEIKCNSGTAAVLSFVFSGLGQIYNGQIKKGLFVVCIACLSMLIFIIGAILIAFWLLGRPIPFSPVIPGFLLFFSGLILICILGAWSIFDAYNVAKD
ncbi:MAG: hypothetical protein ABH914_00385 [Candidatus Omnitrophota bacterium]